MTLGLELSASASRRPRPLLRTLVASWDASPPSTITPISSSFHWVSWWHGPSGKGPDRLLAAPVVAALMLLSLRYLWPAIGRDLKDVELAAGAAMAAAATALGWLGSSRDLGPHDGSGRLDLVPRLGAFGTPCTRISLVLSRWLGSRFKSLTQNTFPC